MSESLVYIGIGSNLGNPEAQVQSALQFIGKIPQSQICKVSSLYLSKPMGPQDQPDYVNAVVSLKTGLEPLALLGELQKIETGHGRVRKGERWGPRTLDLDILLYGEKTLNLPRLTVPHPGLHERAFVLYPLQDINPELIIPTKGSLQELLKACSGDDLKKITI